MVWQFGIHQSGQGGKTDGSSKGYQDPPVARRLVVASPFPGNLPTTYPDPLGPLARVGLGSKHEEVGIDSPAGFQFRWLPVRSVDRSGLAHSGPVVSSGTKGAIHQEPELLHSPAVHVSYRPSDSDGEASLVQSPLHEALSVAPETQLACPGSPGEGNSGSCVSPSSFRLVVGSKQCSSGSTFASTSARSAGLYDASNEGWGAHLGDSTARGVWSEPEGRHHINFLELKAVFLALKSFEHLCRDQIVLIATDNTTVVSYINKEGGMRSGSLCALLWRLLSWCHPRGMVLRARHIPGRLNVIADKLSRHNQVIQTEWISRCSVCCAPIGAYCRWICLPLGSITSPPGLYPRSRISKPGQWTL